MYNKKSKASAILTIISALLMLGVMILMPILMSNTEMEGLGAVFVILLSLIFTYLPLYLSAVPYFIVGLVFGSRMNKAQDRSKLISANKSMLIATCVLLPFLAWGIYGNSDLIANSTLGVVPIVYMVVTALVYVASLIAQIATLVTLKKLPDEPIEK